MVDIIFSKLASVNEFYASLATLIVVHRHVLLPVIVEDLARQTFLFLIGEGVKFLLFDELFILLCEAQPHVVSISLSILLREAETIQHGLRLFHDLLDFIYPSLFHLHIAFLEGLIKANLSHLLDHRSSTHVLGKTRLKAHLINHAFE